MPQFLDYGDGRYAITRVTGPTHTYLSVSFSASAPREPAVEALPPMGQVHDACPDSSLVREAVLRGVDAENATQNSAYSPSTIYFVADDTPDYDAYEECARLLVRQLATSGPFERVPG